MFDPGKFSRSRSFASWTWGANEPVKTGKILYLFFEGASFEKLREAMNQIESAVRWRPWSIGIVMVLFVSLYALSRFGLLQINSVTLVGCGILALSLGWNILVMKGTPTGSESGLKGQVADGLLLTGLVLVFVGAFF